MSNAREKLIDAMMDAHAVMDRYEVVADAIIAALPGLVLPLVWEVDWRGRNVASDYTVFSFPLGFYLEFKGDAILDSIKTLESAKAAADAHHRAQVMAAFGIDTAAMKEGKDA